MATELKTIAFQDIIFPEQSLRERAVTDADVIQLADDIAKRGMTNIMTLDDMGDGTYALADGHGRYAALELLGSQGRWIPGMQAGMLNVQTQPFESVISNLCAQIASNGNKKDTSKKEYINKLVYLQKEGNYSLTELADMSGLSLEYVKSLIKTVRLPEDVRDLIGEGEISLSNGVALSKIYNKVDEEDVEALVLKASNETVSEFLDTIAKTEKAISDARKEEAAARRESGEEAPKAEFAPKKDFVGRARIEEMLEEAISEFDSKPTAENEGALNVLKKIFNVDDAGIAEQQAKWDAKQIEKEEKAAARKLAADQKKAQELQDAIDAQTNGVADAQA